MSAHPKFVGEGATLIETVTRPAANPSGTLEDSPLDKITVSDGFYRIVQYDEDGTELNVSFSVDPAVYPAVFRVGMSNTPEAADESWMFTHQWGVKYGFTIIPKSFPSDPKDGFGGTAGGDNIYIAAKSSGCYPVWRVRCDESRTYRQKDGSTTTVYYFRIQSPGPNEQVWRVETWNPGKPVDTNLATWDPILPNELFQLIPAGGLQPLK